MQRILKATDITLKELSNGSIVVGEKKRETRTVSLAFAFKVGSINENEKNNGISHFIEHALFKGTHNRSSYDIKEPIERVGGTLNAYTGRKSTVYFAQVPYTHAQNTIEILYDMVRNPSFSESEISTEKKVILEEIAESHDDPVDLIYNKTLLKIWDKNYGKPVLGTTETVSTLNHISLADYYNTHYTSNRLVFAVAGNFDNNFLEKAEEMILSFPQPREFPEPIVGSMKPAREIIIEKKKDLKQVHLLLSVKAPSKKDMNFEAFKIFNVLLGSGMSSILFHNIREKYGMVYSIGSEYIAYEDFGTLFIYASTTPNNLQKLMKLLKSELKRIVTNGINSEEFRYGKERLKGKLMMATEGTLPILSRHLDSVMTLGVAESTDEHIAKIDKQNITHTNEVIREYLTSHWNTSLLIPERFDISFDAGFEIP
ncbi:MAG: insulinase family protein [Kosmotoga sp.]|uniref:M16 family metallopeptidase n=1 Tax=Kosmotoga sp. TaxID=1955248 RepID=UPI001D55B2B5|nr:pitrilysin family protein [Kosmotoga sp.]MBO8167105.1 insulinase family protein [Kosmotoga sp.]